MITSAKLFNTVVVAIAAMFAAGCTRAPNEVEGDVQLEAAEGTIVISPGVYKKLKDNTRGDIDSRTYSKSNGKEKVILTSDDINTAVFETGATPGTANFRIKGSKRFVERIVAEAERITGSSANLTRFTLISDTSIHTAFRESRVAVLEKELAQTMTSAGRNQSSFNNVVTIKGAFEKGLHEVRFKYSGKRASLTITIVGDQEFVDEIKSLINKTKDSEG